jgi:hypothetical protein
MADTALMMKRLEAVELEVDTLRWRNFVLEVAFKMLWQFTFAVSEGISSHESASSLREIVSTIQQTLEETLRTDKGSAEERQRRLTALAATMKNLGEIFSADFEIPPLKNQ